LTLRPLPALPTWFPRGAPPTHRSPLYRPCATFATRAFDMVNATCWLPPGRGSWRMQPPRRQPHWLDATACSAALPLPAGTPAFIMLIRGCFDYRAKERGITNAPPPVTTVPCSSRSATLPYLQPVYFTKHFAGRYWRRGAVLHLDHLVLPIRRTVAGLSGPSPMHTPPHRTHLTTLPDRASLRRATSRYGGHAACRTRTHYTPPYRRQFVDKHNIAVLHCLFAYFKVPISLPPQARAGHKQD